jgi:hypothetical protein
MLRQTRPYTGESNQAKTSLETVCGAAQPVCSERSPVSNRHPRPHMSPAVFVPKFSYTGRNAARAHRRPDSNRHAARRFDLAQTLTVWREPNSNRSQGVWRVQLANSKHSPAPNRQPPPRFDDASSNGSLSAHCCCKASYCCRGDAFERHMHVHARAHGCARAGCERLGDAFERSHLCSKSLRFAYGFASKRRAHLNGFDQSLHRRRACTPLERTYVASASFCAFALSALITLSSFARACATASSAFFARVLA